MTGATSQRTSTIFLFAPSWHASLLACLEAWAIEGLLGRCWVVNLEALPDSIDMGAVANLPARALEPTGPRTAPLLESLSATASDLYQVLLAQVFEPGDRGDEPLIERARFFIDTLTPLLLPRDLNAVNVLIPEMGVSDIDPSALVPGWRANIIVAPEDRVADTYPNVGITKSSQLVSHAASALATLGASWAGMNIGPLDGSSHSADGATDPVAVRSFARIARMKDVLDEVAAAALNHAGTDGWEIPSNDDGRPEPVRAASPGQLIDRAVEQAALLDHEALLLRPPLTVEIPPPVRASVFRSLGRMPVHIARMAARAQQATIIRVRRAVAELEEGRALEPEIGANAVDLQELRKRLSTDVIIRRDLEGSRREADRVLQLLGTPPTVGPTPGLWQGLRRFCFGIVDATTIPEPFETPRAGALREVITRPEWLTSDPASGFFRLSQEVSLDGQGLSRWAAIELSTNDSLNARWLERDLEEAIEAATPGGGGSESDNRDQHSLQKLESELRRLRDWISDRETSFLWKLGERVGTNVGAAVTLLLEAKPVVENGWGSIDFGAPASRSRRLHRVWLAILLMWLAIVGLNWGGVVEIGSTPLVAMVGAVIAAVIAFSFFHAFARFMARWETEAQRILANYKQALLNLYAGGRETTRLGALYVQLTDWAEIIGWTLHHPWERYEDQLDDERVFTAEPIQALQLADVRPGQTQLRDLGARARRKLHSEGWVSNIYEAALSGSAGEFAAIRGLSNRDQLDPDHDTPYQETGARNALVGWFRSGRPMKAALEAGTARVAAFYETLSPADVFAHATAEPSSSVLKPMPAAEFLNVMPSPDTLELQSTLWDDVGKTKSLNRVERSLVWSFDDRIVKPPQVELIATPATTDQYGAYLVRTIRLDMTERAPSERFSIFRDPDQRGSATEDDSSPGQW